MRETSVTEPDLLLEGVRQIRDDVRARLAAFVTELR
jgi:hypothetical protein